jgi:ferritin-like protein
MANDSSRREILIASAALAGGAGAALIASCGGGGSKTKSTETVSTIQMQDDAAILNTLLDLESSAIVAYDVVAGKLSGSDAAFARRLRGQEQVHANALRKLIPPLGLAPQPAKSPAEYAATFPALRDRRTALGFALDVEDTAIGAYADAIGKVVTDSVRGRLAAILATEAEHAAVVLGRLGRPQAPQAFVTGPPAQGSG